MTKKKIFVVGLFAVLVVGIIVYDRGQKQDQAQKTQAEAPQLADADDADPGTNSVNEAINEIETKEKAQLDEEKKRFAQLTEEAKADLPTREQLSQLNAKEVHQTPEVVLQGAVSVGRVAQALSDNQMLVSDGLKFYRECAENEANAVAIRAECFSSHEDLLKKHHLKDESLEKDSLVSEQVKKLVRESR